MGPFPHSQSVIAISVFWVIFVAVFLVFMYWLRMRRNNHKLCCSARSTTNEDVSHPIARTSIQNPSRFIQIYYIGNTDSTTESSSSTTNNILDKILARIDDLPPSYEEVTNAQNETGDDSIINCDNAPPTLSNSTEMSSTSEGDFIVIVERTSGSYS